MVKRQTARIKRYSVPPVYKADRLPLDRTMGGGRCLHFSLAVTLNVAGTLLWAWHWIRLSASSAQHKDERRPRESHKVEYNPKRRRLADLDELSEHT
jgi:hypothetical protein